MSDERRTRTRRAFLGALGTAAAVGAAGCTETEDAEGTRNGAGDRWTPEDATGTPEATSEYSRVYRETIDSVVLVRVFGPGGQSQGSGFVYDGDYVVTNQHVVEGADALEIRFAQGDWREGDVVGTDVYSDLAVVEVEEPPEYADPLALRTRDPAIGTEVVALGNPFGFGESVSAGIVSGVNRSLPAPNNFVIPDAIQTDAAVNPGNSGGPLVTLDGQVVGVINSGGGDNLGFAISGALIRRVVPELIEDGEYEHSYMGVRLLGVTPTIADANGLDEVTGVMITEVVEDGPSDGTLEGATGERVVNDVRVPVGGDVIRRIDDRPIPTQSALSTYLALYTAPGDTISVELIRDGERETVELTLGRRPEP